MSTLSEEQRLRIAESKRKALALRAAKQQEVTEPASAQTSKSTIHNQGKPNNVNTNYSKVTSTGNSLAPSKHQLRIASQQKTLHTQSSTGATYAKPKNADKTKSSQVTPSLQELVTMDFSPGKNNPFAVKGTCRLVSRERFQVDIGYSPPLVELFKSMPTKQYDANRKVWNFHLCDYPKLIKNMNALGNHFCVEPLPKSAVMAFGAVIQGEVSEKLPLPDADLTKHVDGELVESLMPFQREGINFVIQRNGRALIADDMGLGKTLQALGIMAYYRPEWPALIVVPSSVRFAWREQILKWLPSVDPQEINVVTSGRESSTSGLLNIISYDLLVKRKQELYNARFKVVIMDESHSLKNIKTARTQACLPIFKTAKRILLLSGTPALSRPNELFTQISAVDPALFPKFHDFGLRYCDGKQNAWGWDFSGSSNLTELQLILEEKIMIRRLKSEVMSQLPSKCRQVVLLDPGSVKVNKGMKQSQKLVDKLRGSERRGALLEYFHETGGSKIPAVREYVLEQLENDRKLLLFAHHQEVLDAVEEAVSKKYALIRIDGRTSSEQRAYFVNKFQSSDVVKIAILSIAAANSGLNLTAANLVIFAELFWNPGILMQAEDRAHRIGQEDNVTVHYLVAKGTSDDYLWPLIQQKLHVLGKAGLSKDNFTDADTKVLKDPKQKEIIEFLETSFAEDLSDDNIKQESPAEPIKPSATDRSDHPKDKQSNLFQYLKPKTDCDKNQNKATKQAKDSCFNCVSNTHNSHPACENLIDDDDWLDDVADELWETEMNPEVPQPPPNKIVKYP